MTGQDIDTKQGSQPPKKKNEDAQERRPGGGYDYTEQHDDWAGNEPERRDESGRQYDRDRSDMSPDDFEDFDDT